LRACFEEAEARMGKLDIVMDNGGSIINTSSDAAKGALPGYGQYAATKAAVCSLTRVAAMELVPRKIRVNAICPGSVWSEMLPPDHPEVALTKLLTPMGRVG
jgi:NAD(P)-dependent dehydrogenase (short-subunit alcohol dehydrogenase family)